MSEPAGSLPALIGSASVLDGVVQDARHAIRRLRRDWRFTASAVLILGLGIGANTAIFSLVNAALLRPQSVADPDRLVDIYQVGMNPGGIDADSYPAYLDMAQHTDVFASITAVLVPRGVEYLDEGGLHPAIVEHTTSSYLSVLGLRPFLGRWFGAEEDTPGAAVVAVVSHTAWIKRFGGNPSVVGRQIRIDGVPVTIVGVGPAGHDATIDIGIVTDFWLPISSLPALGAPPRVLERRPDEAAFLVKARLHDGISVGQARAAMDILGRRLAAEYPKEDPGRGITVVASRGVRVHPQIDAILAPLASVLLGIVGLVLAIACSNLATLLLVRGTARAKEMGVRLAIGATRWRLVRHVLTESALLSAAGGVLGGLLAWWTTEWLGSLDLPAVVHLHFDWRVLAFALALSLGTGVGFGLAPALGTTGTDIVPILRHAGESRFAGRRRLTLKNALVLVQVALSVLLLGLSSLSLQMLSASRTRRLGFATDGLAILETDLRYGGYSGPDAPAALEDLRRRVAVMPGVQSAVLTRGLPMQTTGMRVVVDDAAGGPAVVAGAIWAGPGYFETLRIGILYGRAIDERDRLATPQVAVISESMARRCFGTVNAVGRRFRSERDAGTRFEVIGVARDTGTADLAGNLVDLRPELFYRSFTQAGRAPTTVIARTSLGAPALAGGLVRELHRTNAALPVVSATTMARYVEDSLLVPKTAATVLAALGALGLCLAGIGLYSVVAFEVARRSREIGIRMALGARSRQVIWTVAHGVAGLVGIGTTVGLALSVAAALAVRAVYAPAPGLSLYRPRTDPVALLAIAMIMAAVGVAATFAPARRAALGDPAAALRQE